MHERMRRPSRTTSRPSVDVVPDGGSPGDRRGERSRIVARGDADGGRVQPNLDLRFEPDRTSDASETLTRIRRAAPVQRTGASGGGAAPTRIQRWEDGKAVQGPAIQPSRVKVKIGDHGFSPADIFNRLEQLPFFKQKLAERIRVRQYANEDDALSWGRHVEEALRYYAEHKADDHRGSTNRAMSIAIALQGVGRVVANNVLYDPGLTSTCATHLLELYKPEIEQALGGMQRPKTTMKLAKSLVSDDPVAMFIHGEITKERAALRIRTMAAKAGMADPIKMLDLLREKFEVDIATISKRNAAINYSSKDNAYQSNEGAGMISLPYMRRLFGQDFGASDPNAKPAWKASGDLAFTKDTKAQFAALKAEVLNPTPVQAVTTVDGTSEKQSLQMRAVEQSDAQYQGGDDATVAAAIQQLYGGNMSLSTAEAIRKRVQAKIGTMPVTISFGAERWFGSGGPRAEADGSVLYKAHAARTEQMSFRDAFGKRAKGKKDRNVSHLGKWTPGVGETQDRGEMYNKFRYWKDFVGMTKGRELDETDAPVFAAANLNWAAVSSRTDKETGSEKFAVNAYGDGHFVLKPSAVRNRVLYTAECEGTPHRDPYLAFVDALVGGVNISGESKVYADIAMHIINSVTTNTPVPSRTQYFEVQVFGAIDVTKDVQEIVAAPSVGDAAKQNIIAFAAKHGIRFTSAKEPASGIKSTAWLTSDDAMNAIKVFVHSEQSIDLRQARQG